MRRRDDIMAVLAAALIVYSVLLALSAERRFAEADGLRNELELRAASLREEADALSARLAAPPSDELIEQLAREKLGLVRRGEILFYFSTDREG